MSSTESMITIELIDEIAIAVCKKFSLRYQGNSQILENELSLDLHSTDAVANSISIIAEKIFDALRKVRLYGLNVIEEHVTKIKAKIEDLKGSLAEKYEEFLGKLDRLIACTYLELFERAARKVPPKLETENGVYILENISFTHSLALEGGFEISLIRILKLVAEGTISLQTQYRWQENV